MSTSPTLISLRAPPLSISPPPPKPTSPWLPTAQLLSQYPILHHLATCNSMKQLHQIHSQTITSGAIHDNFVASRILSFAALSPAGSLPYANLLFSCIQEPDAFVANILIRAFAYGPNPFDALLFYTQILLESYVQCFPDVHTFPVLLKACSKIPLLSFGEMVHAQVIKYGLAYHVSVQNFLVRMYSFCGQIELARVAFDEILEYDDASWNIMLGGYLECGCFEDARRLFDEMGDRGVVSWSVMINGYVQNSRFSEGLELFQEMLKAKVEPNESVLVNVLCACAHMGAMDQGRWLEGYMRKRDVNLTVRISTALVDMYLKCGCIEKALEIFNAMDDKNEMAWAAMIGGLAINGRGNDALQLFSKMEMDGILPNEVTFVAVLNACSHSGMVDDGLNYFRLMREVYGIEPNMQHYCCLVDLYGRAGLLDKAEEVIKTMPMKPNSAVWGALLNACKIHGNTVLGEQVGKRLLDMEPTNSGRYVVLSNLYASNARWEDAAEVRKIMKQRGVTKTPGSSFIDLKGSIHEFVVGDNSHPRRKDIYFKLDEISKELKQAGYKPSMDQALHDMDDEEKETALRLHSEKLAIAFGLISSDPGSTIRITKNLRVCADCHTATKLISKVYNRDIVVRDRSRFHHFSHGSCSCNDYW